MTELLTHRLPDPSPQRRRLRQIIDHARIGYLERWAIAVAGEDSPKPERLSRTVAAHLLDLGYTPSFLRTWVDDLWERQVDAVGLVEDAARLARAEPRDFEVLVALIRVPQRPTLAEPLDNWRPKEQVIAWLEKHGHDTSGVRRGGGFVYQVRALDPFGAAARVSQFVERLVARSSFLRRRAGVQAYPQVWVAGHPDPIPSRHHRVAPTCSP